jgi:hypothetical protein
LSGDLKNAWSLTHSEHQSQRGGRVDSKVNTLNKNMIFFTQQFFKTLKKITGNSISNCDFFKVYNFCFGRGENITRLGRYL